MTLARAERVIDAARAWIGTPYHDQASLQGVGCDCLGLARGVWRTLYGDPEPYSVPVYSRRGEGEALAAALAAWLVPVPVAEAGPGHLVLFRPLRWSAARHVGILTGDALVHAHERRGVVEEPLGPWRRRAAFAFGFPAQRRTNPRAV